MARQEFDAFAAVAATRLYRAAYLMVGSHDLAEDLVQDVLARVYVAWPRIQADPHGYAYRALGNAVANQRRWAMRHPESPLSEDHNRTSVGDIADAVADQEALLAALATLPHRQRTIVVLRYYADLTETQTAAALGINVGTVKSQHSRAVAALRDHLGRYLGGFDDTEAAAPATRDVVPESKGTPHEPRPA